MQTTLIADMTTNRWTKLFWCSACKPAAMSQPKFSNSPWLSNDSTLDSWPRKYVFKSPYTHRHHYTSHVIYRATDRQL